MNIQPLGDRVLIRALKESEVTKSGIVLPDTAEKEKPEKGEVIAVGEGRLNDEGKRIPLNVQKGDKIIFSKYGPDEIKIDDEELLIIKQEDILAKY
ncbi:co-chaperone GroES [Patescibacteria group bacterium]|nr:co-chaperone GroES [Patescibacteria group bacterium]